MLRTGILNPQINSLLSRVRHTNTLVIADRGFPFWPQIETVDITLVDDVPTVLQVLEALVPNFIIGKAWMAAEFREQRIPKFLGYFERVLSANPAGGAHLAGAALSYADLGLFQALEGLRYAFPRALAAHEGKWPAVFALRDRVAAQPRIAAYLASRAP